LFSWGGRFLFLPFFGGFVLCVSFGRFSVVFLSLGFVFPGPPFLWGFLRFGVFLCVWGGGFGSLLDYCSQLIFFAAKWFAVRPNSPFFFFLCCRNAARVLCVGRGVFFALSETVVGEMPGFMKFARHEFILLSFHALGSRRGFYLPRQEYKKVPRNLA